MEEYNVSKVIIIRYQTSKALFERQAQSLFTSAALSLRGCTKGSQKADWVRLTKGQSKKILDLETHNSHRSCMQKHKNTHMRYT